MRLERSSAFSESTQSKKKNRTTSNIGLVRRCSYKYQTAEDRVFEEEPDFGRMEAMSPVDVDDRKISPTQLMHPRQRDEQ